MSSSAAASGRALLDVNESVCETGRKSILTLPSFRISKPHLIEHNLANYSVYLGNHIDPYSVKDLSKCFSLNPMDLHGTNHMQAKHMFKCFVETLCCTSDTRIPNLKDLILGACFFLLYSTQVVQRAREVRLNG